MRNLSMGTGSYRSLLHFVVSTVILVCNLHLLAAASPMLNPHFRPDRTEFSEDPAPVPVFRLLIYLFIFLDGNYLHFVPYSPKQAAVTASHATFAVTHYNSTFPVPAIT